jgi:DNA-directed RNA polymerase subunit D
MPITSVLSEDNRLVLVVEGYPLALVNAIRRSTILYTPVMAVDEVYIIENNSPLYDEMLAHRLGMIPFDSEEALTKYKRPEECGPEDRDCSTKIYLVKKVEQGEPPTWVYTSEIKSDDPEVKPTSAEIPIVLLAPGQSVSLEAKLRLGYGIEHAKYIPVSVAVVRYYPKVEVSEDCVKAAEVCPKKVFSVEGDKVKVADEMSCILCEECVKACGDKVRISAVEDKYIVEIESTGVLRPKTILREAIKSLRRKLEEFSQKVEVLRQ